MPHRKKHRELKERLESEGFSDLKLEPTSTHEDGSPKTWHGTGMRDGSPVTLHIDHKDNAIAI